MRSRRLIDTLRMGDSALRALEIADDGTCGTFLCMAYDKSAKTYVRSPDFIPIFPDISKISRLFSLITRHCKAKKMRLEALYSG